MSFVEDPLKDPLHVRRDEVAQDLLASLDAEGHAARAIFDTRRMGKSDFLRGEFTELARARGYLVIYHSFYTGTRHHQCDFLRQLAHYTQDDGLYEKTRAFAEGWLALLDARRFKSVKAGLKEGGVEYFEDETIAPAVSPEEQMPYMLDEVFSALVKRHPKVLLILDEFQELAKGPPAHVTANAGFIKALRTALDTRKGFIRTVFAGSHQALLKRLFSNRANAFFGFADSFELTHFDEAFVREIARRLVVHHRRDITPEQVDALCGHFTTGFGRSPKRLRMAFTKLHESRGRKGVPEVAAAVMEELPEKQDFSQKFLPLTPIQQAVLVRIALFGGHGLFSAGACAAYSEYVGEKVTPQDAQAARDFLCGKSKSKNPRLTREALITSDPEEGNLFLDEDFRDWVAEHHADHETA